MATYFDSELGSVEWKYLDGDVWRRHRKSYETRKLACAANGTVLWQRGASRRNSCLDYAFTNLVLVSQIEQLGKRDVIGEKAETVGTAAPPPPSN